MPIITTTFRTPIGDMIAGATDAGICLLDFMHRKSLPAIQQRIAVGLNESFAESTHPLLDDLRKELEEYFAGERSVFSVPLLPVGSGFQKKVWEHLQSIGYGSISTYLKQAKAYGAEKAIRAIAAANGMNGLAIVIPCHRVIGTNGSLTGYAGGLPAKRWLLDHEQKHAGGEVQAALF